MTPAEPPRTVQGLLEKQAVLRPDAPALIFGDTTRTYAQLDARATAFATALAARGVGRGDRVALLLHNGIEFVECLFGCLKAGACAVPVNFRLVEPEVAFILQDAGAVGIVAGTAFDRLAADAVGAPFANAGPGGSFRITTGASDTGAEAYETVLAGAVDTATAEPHELALLLYTSGTTGTPKGVRLTHANLLAQTDAWLAEMQVTGDDVWLSGQPLFHIGGLNGLLPFLAVGAPSIVTSSTRFDAARMIELLDKHHVTRCIFVPTQWDDVCRAPGARSIGARGTLRTALWGAAAAPRATLELIAATFPDVAIVSAFGQTELSGTTTFLQGHDALRKLGSVGLPLPGVELRLVDDDGCDVPAQAVGEVVYRGPTVMAGYHGLPGATAETVVDGWLHSGDLARRDEDGYLYVVDRKKDLLISGGENVYPAEVELVLREHPAVADVAVVGVPHLRWGETPLAVIVLAAGQALDTDDLLRYCRGRLAGYKRPAGVEAVAALPRNAGGKVLKRELRERYAARFMPAADPAGAGPR